MESDYPLASVCTFVHILHIQQKHVLFSFKKPENKKERVFYDPHRVVSGYHYKCHQLGSAWWCEMG